MIPRSIASRQKNDQTQKYAQMLNLSAYENLF